MARANDQIGPYTLIRQIGRGGYGVVWLAERRGAVATTRVALKLPVDDDPDLNAIMQESQLWARIGGHPNVLSIIEADIYDNQVVVVSEYAPDGSLDDWLKRHNGVAPSLTHAMRMVLGILNGLAHLHDRKIIHRDLKPANILLQGETPRLADFGLARVLKMSGHSGVIAGTPQYMAPETFDGKRSEKSDIWAVGVTLFQLLCGQLPFPQTDVSALMGAIIMKPPEPLPDTIPDYVKRIVFRALHKDVNLRYQTAQEMQHDVVTVFSTMEGYTHSDLAKWASGASIAILEAVTVPEVVTMPTLSVSQIKYTESVQINNHRFKFDHLILNAKGETIASSNEEVESCTLNINEINFDLVQIPAGQFTIGSPDNEYGRAADESPQQLIKVDKFYLGKYTITQAQWRLVAALPKIERDLVASPSRFNGDDLPVENISWFDAIEFCARLSQYIGKVFRLPSEVEWEYACRAGTNTPFAYGETLIAKVANFKSSYPYKEAPPENSRETTIAVGSLGFANKFGLFDMHGNVWEWCADYYRSYQIAQDNSATVSDKLSNVKLRVMRGGSWSDDARYCRSAWRGRNLPSYRNINLGLRVVLDLMD